MKSEWLYICLNMMIAYVPQKLETRKGRESIREFFDHYMVVSDLLTTRFQTRVQGLSGDDEGKAIFEQRMGMDFDNLMQLLERTSLYTLRMSENFLVVFNNWLQDEGLYELAKEIPSYPYEYLDELS